MRRTVCIVAGLCLVLSAIPAAAADPAQVFQVRQLTDRVVVLTEISPWESNHVVVVGAEGLVLVDPGHSALMGRLIREAARAATGRDRFAYVVDSHGHWGHAWGNAAFPEALVIGHELAVASMEADSGNLARRAEVIRGQLEQGGAALAGLDPESDEAAAATLRRDHLDRIAGGLSEPGFAVRLPQLSFSERLDLDLGDLRLEMHWLGRGHSDSDIAILIPEEKVLLLGCFFLEQGPLPSFGTQRQLDPDRWLEVFDTLLDGGAEIEHVVLGQHTVWPRARLVAMRDYIARLWSEVARFDAEGVDFETAMGRLPVPPELDALRPGGASDDDLARYHRTEVEALWRQFKDSAAAAVEQATRDGGVNAGVARYRELSKDAATDVYFDENEFNQSGYRLLGEGRVEEAIAVFELNVERYPQSWNAYDSLGEACAVKGDRERAIDLYRRSLELNPDNTNGAEALRRLGADAPEDPAAPKSG